METKSNPNPTAKLSEKLIEALGRAQREIEELAVQLSLGKAEASDKFEELKKDFTQRLVFWKMQWMKHFSSEATQEKFEELRLQLALGKAEALGAFEEQQKKIMMSLEQLEQDLKNNPGTKNLYEEFSIEYEKLKLKLEILKMKYELRKLKTTSGFSKEMEDAKRAAEEAFHKKITSAKSSLSDARKEIGLAFRHMHNALKKL